MGDFPLVHRISLGDMPPKNKYILIYVCNRPWVDSADQVGVFWRVAKMKVGISKARRSELAALGSFRALIYRSEDEDGNNKVPYYFDGFGPDSYFGQEVDYWAYLPDLPVPLVTVVTDDE